MPTDYKHATQSTSRTIHGAYAEIILLMALVCSGTSMAQEDPVVVDATMLEGKVLCGYQGWFRCPGDAAGQSWVHWSNDPNRIAPDTLTFDMWPDMSEMAPGECFAAPGFTHPDGSQASLFSSENAATVLRHFKWMRQYGIQGIWLQHFVVDLPGGPIENRYDSRMRVLANVRAAANETGRVWALSYDMAGMPAKDIFTTLSNDWKRQVDSGLTKDPRYLHHNGKPVLMAWGFYRGSHMTAEVANQVIDFLKNDPVYGVFLVGGCEWGWRTNPDPEWAKFLRRFDAISPWNVGNYTVKEDGTKWASTAYWKEDLAEARRVGMLYLPVVYPGFSWDNLMKNPAGKSCIPRQEGKFLWKQFNDVAELGVDMAYIAMFDEVDEGTAIFKVTNTPPVQAHFVTYEDQPSDLYLRLAGEGTRMILKQRPISANMP